MKKKMFLIGVIFVCIIIVFLVVRLAAGWKPFKNFKYDDLNHYTRVVSIDLEQMERVGVEQTKTQYFVKMLNGIRVTAPYKGEYDPWSMMYFVYQRNGEDMTYHRIGVTCDPAPIIDIDGKLYRLDPASAETYQDFWKNHRKAGYFKVGE